MTRRLLALLLLATPLFAGESTRSPYPDDYTVSPCVDLNYCQSWREDSFISAAGTMSGYLLDRDWAEAHYKEMLKNLEPICTKAATCFTIEGNDFVFCDNIVRQPELLFTACSGYAPGSKDDEQCRLFARHWMKGKDFNAKAEWVAMQECGRQHPQSGERTMDVWFGRDDYRPGEKPFQVLAIDSQTHVPLNASVAVEGVENVYSKETTDGRLHAGYDIPAKVHLKRVPNKDGHTDVTAPMVTLTMPGYPTVKLPLAVKIPTMAVAAEPAISKLRPGTNTITIRAYDVDTKQPVDARVMAGDRVLGHTNEPVKLTIERGKKAPQIWVTSLYDMYSDVVVR